MGNWVLISLIMLLAWNNTTAGTEENMMESKSGNNHTGSVHKFNVQTENSTPGTKLNVSFSSSFNETYASNDTMKSLTPSSDLFSNTTSSLSINMIDQTVTNEFEILNNFSSHEISSTQKTPVSVILEEDINNNNTDRITEFSGTTIETDVFIAKRSSTFLSNLAPMEEDYPESSFITETDPPSTSVESLRNSTAFPSLIKLSTSEPSSTSEMFEVNTEEYLLDSSPTTNASVMNMDSSKNSTTKMDLNLSSVFTTTDMTEIEETNLKNNKSGKGTDIKTSILPRMRMVSKPLFKNLSLNYNAGTSPSLSPNDQASLYTSPLNFTEGKSYSSTNSSLQNSTSIMQEILVSTSQSITEEASAENDTPVTSTVSTTFLESQDDKQKKYNFSVTIKEESKKEINISITALHNVPTSSNTTSSVNLSPETSSLPPNEKISQHSEQSNSSERNLFLENQNWESPREQLYTSSEQSTTQQISVENKMSITVSSTAVSFHDNQQKELLFRHVNNLTDVQRNTMTVDITFISTVDTVEWFHSYDSVFRATIASLLTISNGSQPTHSINVVYIAPTPIQNGNYFCVSFMVGHSLQEDIYETGEKIVQVINTNTSQLVKMLHFPVDSVRIGFNESDKCHKSSKVLPGGNMVPIIIPVTIMVIAIVAIVIICVRKFIAARKRFDSPFNDEVQAWGTRKDEGGRYRNGCCASDYSQNKPKEDAVPRVNLRKAADKETKPSVSHHGIESVLVHKEENSNLESQDGSNDNQTFIYDTKL